MTIRISTFAVSSLLAFGLGSLTASHADYFVAPADHSGYARDNEAADQGRLMPLDRAVSMVQSRFSATAVKTDTVNDGGQVLYRIRLISADRARVWTVTVDARSGQVY